ncbi:MAG: HlyD family efflux transporter periplasmic adaptor subunit [Planctomycetota bacterium]
MKTRSVQNPPRALANPTRRGGTLAKVLVLIAVAGGIGGAVVASGILKRSLGGDSAGVQTAEIARVSIASFDITTTASGDLQAEEQIEVRSKLERDTTIVSLVPEGTRVEAGDQLAELNADALQRELDDEEIGLESDRAELIAAENSLEIQKSDNESAREAAELKLRLAELSLEQWINGDHAIKIQELELSIEEADRELERLRDKHERSQELLQEGFVSEDQAKQDELSYIKAQAQVNKVRLQRESYVLYEQKREREQKESDVEQARAELGRVERQNEIRIADKSANLASRQRRVARRENEIRELNEQIENSVIRAPSAGLVVYGSTVQQSRNSWNTNGPMQIGQQVYPNQLLFALPDVTKLLAEVRVHESLAGRIAQGQRTMITVDAANGQTYSGTVKEIGILAENGGWRDPNLREYTVKIAIDYDNAAGDLKPSMRCEAAITLGRVEESLAVPVPAVFNQGEVRYVYVPDGRGLFRRVPVQTGRFSDSFAEIVAGLEDGSEVLLREPSPGEIVDEPWQQAELELVGLTLDSEGQPVRAANESARVTPAAYRGG